jgi:hypothetical protein
MADADDLARELAAVERELEEFKADLVRWPVAYRPLAAAAKSVIQTLEQRAAELRRQLAGE